MFSCKVVKNDNLKPPWDDIQSILAFNCVTEHRQVGTVVASGSRAVLQIGRSLVRFQMVSLEFFIFRYGPGVGSASNRNEHQEHFLGLNEAGA